MQLPSNGMPSGGLPHGVALYVVDVLPRGAINIDLGGTSGQFRELLMGVSHPDAYSGANDVVGMTVWGDVDPRFHPRIATTVGASAPMPFQPQIPLVLSAGPGTKTINVRLHFQSGRTIDEVGTYTLTDGEPHVTVLQQPLRAVLGSADSFKLGWSCSHDLTQIEVCLTTDYDAARADAFVVLFGTNTNVSGSWVAGQYIESVITYPQAAFALASIASMGQVYVKVFATTAKGVTR